MKFSTIDGIDVVDAHKKVVLHISPRDINSARVKNPASCAAARACVRDLNCKEARVHLSRVFLKMRGKWVRYNTPGSLRAEIIAFDRGGKFSPGEYTLMAPPPSHRARHNRHSANYQYPKRRKNSKRRTYHVVRNVRAHALSNER